MKYKRPWKKNLNKIPIQIIEKIAGFDSDECIVACAIKIDLEKIQSGLFSHLGLRWDEGKSVLAEHIVPPSGIGSYSRRNRDGYEIVYKDQPKTIKSWTIEAPNYGDWDKGSHDIVFTKEVYRRDYIGPKLLTIRVDRIGEDISEQAHVFKFTVGEVLDRRAPDFDSQLLFNLNLLQENTGNHDVYESEASLDDYLRTLYVNWEILPPGERDDVIVRILAGTKSSDPKVRASVADRYDFLLLLEPRCFIKGTSGFRRYFGAQFADDLVVFENIEYGNAIYVMFDDWEELSQKTRTELLSSGTHNFERIRHTKTWKRRLGKLLWIERMKRGLM